MMNSHLVTSVRVAEDKDRSSIFKLVQELGYNTIDVKEFKKTWKQIEQAQTMGILVAITEEIVSGYMLYSFKPLLRIAGFSMEIDELSISSSYRGHGIGSKLLSEAKVIAKQKGIKKIIISTNRERESYKRSFYTKNGFQEKNSAWLVFDL